jgi:hypothetical protein
MSYTPPLEAETTGFKTTTPLTAATTLIYNSPLLEVDGYTQVQTEVFSDQDGTMTFEFLSDAGGTDVVRTLVVPYTASNGYQLFAAPAFTNYVRYEFNNNSGSDQTDFYFTTKLLTTSLSPQTLRADGFIASAMMTNLTRSIVTGQQPDGDYVNNKADGLAFNTSTPLGIGATYTSPWVDTDGYNVIQIHIESDVVSDDRGIDVQFTNNVQGTPSPLIVEEFFYTFSQKDIDRGYLELDFPTKMDGFRFIYTNGSVAQSSFIIEADLRTNATPNRYSTGGALIVGDFKKEVALGNVPNYTGSSKFGLVTTTDAADPERTVWAMANDDAINVLDRKTFPTATGTLHMASTNSGDTAKEITIVYCDANNIKRVVTGNLNGQTPVSLGVTAIDANTAFITEPNGSLLGDVYISLNSSYTSGVPTTLSDTICFIPQADGRSQQATFRVPNNTRMLLETVYITITRASGSPGSALIKLKHKPNGKAEYTLRPYSCTTSNIIDRKEDLVFEQGDLIEFTVANVSDTDTDVNVVFDYELLEI